MRKTVFIPVVPMAAVPGAQLLELLVEPGPLGVQAIDTSHLEIHGLGTAVKVARTALEHFSEHFPDAMLHRDLTPIKGIRRPVLFVRNPMREISNAEGASLGIALGIMMYDKRCPRERIIATGRFAGTQGKSCTTLLAPSRLEGQLEAALSLGRQEETLLFIVPAWVDNRGSARPVRNSLITDLAALNIRVLPVKSFEEAVTICWRFFDTDALDS